MTKSHYSYKEFLPLRVLYVNLHAYTLCIICGCKKNMEKTLQEMLLAAYNLQKKQLKRMGTGCLFKALLLNTLNMRQYWKSDIKKIIKSVNLPLTI